MHTVVSTAGCTSVYLSAERPLRLRHVHRHYPHALSTLAYTHSHTHACTHEHTALMRQGILSLRPQCPLVASPGMVAGPQLVTLWSPGHCQDLFCPPPRASCPQFLRSSQRALQNRAGQERSDAHQRTSPGVSQPQPLPAPALLPEPSFAKAVPSAGNALSRLFHLTHSYPSRPSSETGRGGSP